MTSVPSQRSGMTAIEVLAATMLASLMMAAVVGVLSGLTRQQKLLIGKDNRQPWHDQLKAQLEWDLKNSQTMTVATDSLKLEGFAVRDFATSVPTGRPSLVEYYVDRKIPAGALLRRETHLDEQTNDNSRTELVCVGIDSMVIGDEARTPGKLSAPRTTNPQPATPVPTPEHVGISLTQNGGLLLFQDVTIR